MSKGGGDTIIGYNYFFGIHMGVGRGPIDELVEVKAGDRTAWPSGTYSDPNAAPAPDLEYEREYPPNIEIEAPVIIGAGPDYSVTINIDSPETFVVDSVVTIDGLTRSAQDVDGDYTIVERVPYTSTFTGTSEGVWETTPGHLTINIGSDATLRGKWTTVSGAAAGATPITMTVDPDTTGGYGEVSSTATESGTIYIDAPELFGGKQKEGGVQGPCVIMMGEDTQVAPPGLVAMHAGAALPGYRGVFTMFFDGLIASMNPYPKAWSMRVRRALKGWDGDVWEPDLAIINLSRELASGETSASTDIKAMNPAHIIYECLTNRLWGRGLPRTRIDEDSFLLAAQTLYDEGFGLCLKWARRDSIQSFVQSVLDHIGGVLYQNRSTAKLSLKLIRAIEDTSTLPLFEPGAGLLTITEATIATGGNYVNEVIVTYVDPITGKQRPAKADNIASLQANGGQFVSVKKDYPGLPTHELGTRVAQRDLKAQGLELRRFTCVLDRRAWDLTPGDAIRIKDLSRGIRETVVRIGDFKDGTITKGEITVKVLQDMFALPTNSYIANQPPGGGGVIEACVGEFEVFEVPYAILAGSMSAANFAQIGDTDGYLGVVMARSVPANSSYQIAVRDGVPTIDDAPPDHGVFCGAIASAVDMEYIQAWASPGFDGMSLSHNVLTFSAPVSEEPDIANWTDLKCYLVDFTWDDKGSVGGNVTTVTPPYVDHVITSVNYTDPLTQPLLLSGTTSDIITVVTDNVYTPLCQSYGTLRWTGKKVP